MKNGNNLSRLGSCHFNNAADLSTNQCSLRGAATQPVLSSHILGLHSLHFHFLFYLNFTTASYSMVNLTVLIHYIKIDI